MEELRARDPCLGDARRVGLTDVTCHPAYSQSQGGWDPPIHRFHKARASSLTLACPADALFIQGEARNGKGGVPSGVAGVPAGPSRA